MVAALVVPISGPYVGTYGGFALGTQNDDGFALLGTWQGQEINASDAFGMTLVEAIYRGINWRMRFRGLEFNRTGMLFAMQIFGSTGSATATFTPHIGSNLVAAGIGDRWSKSAQPLVLTAILANPPTMPQTLTATNAAVAPQHNTELLMTSKMREVPFEMVLLPYQAVVGSLTVNLAFTTT